MLSNQISPLSAKEQLKDFIDNRKPDYLGEVLKFSGVGEYDVYNPSIPFEINGETVLAGRVEDRANEVTQPKFFKQIGDVWTLIEDAPVFDLQDPFAASINGGTPADIRADALHTFKSAGKNGGFIMGSSHSLTIGATYENIMEMKEYRDGLGVYPLK